jgi:alpha/beta superfamily hydrolase
MCLLYNYKGLGEVRGEVREEIGERYLIYFERM